MTAEDFLRTAPKIDHQPNSNRPALPERRSALEIISATDRVTATCCACHYHSRAPVFKAHLERRCFHTKLEALIENHRHKGNHRISFTPLLIDRLKSTEVLGLLFIEMTNARAVSRTLLAQPDSVSITRVGHFLPSCERKVRSPLSLLKEQKEGQGRSLSLNQAVNMSPGT